MAFLFKKSHENGSAIVIVVLIMAVLSICCVTFWQKSLLFYDISLKRLEYEQKYRVAACGLEYAASVCSGNFSVFINSEDISGQGFGLLGQDFQDAQGLRVPARPNPKASDNSKFEIETDEFKFSENIKYKCKIYIAKNGAKTLDLKSVLVNASGEKVFEISCSLLVPQNVDLKDKNAKKFLVKDWKVCDK